MTWEWRGVNMSPLPANTVFHLATRLFLVWVCIYDVCFFFELYLFHKKGVTHHLTLCLLTLSPGCKRGVVLCSSLPCCLCLWLLALHCLLTISKLAGLLSSYKNGVLLFEARVCELGLVNKNKPAYTQVVMKVCKEVVLYIEAARYQGTGSSQSVRASSLYDGISTEQAVGYVLTGFSHVWHSPLFNNEISATETTLAQTGVGTSSGLSKLKPRHRIRRK